MMSQDHANVQPSLFDRGLNDGILEMRMATIFGVLVLIAGYTVIAALIFPDEPEL